MYRLVTTRHESRISSKALGKFQEVCTSVRALAVDVWYMSLETLRKSPEVRTSVWDLDVDKS